VPTVLAQGTSIPRVNRPKVVPAAMAVIEVQMLRIPLNCSRTNTSERATKPRTMIVDLTKMVEALSLGCILKQPRTISSRITKEVELRTTERELKAAPNIPAINNPDIP